MKISKVFFKKQSIVDGEKGFPLLAKPLLFSDVLKKPTKLTPVFSRHPEIKATFTRIAPHFGSTTTIFI